MCDYSSIVHLRSIYENNGKTDLAAKSFEAMTRKFNQSLSVWVAYGLFKFRQGVPEEAQAVLKKALTFIPKQSRKCLPSPMFAS
jgi:Tfp pilus assembly protein PilF